MADAKAKTGLCKVVGKGVIGEPGLAALVHHEVTGDLEVVMVVRNTKTSLCGNTGAIAVLTVNGKPASYGSIQPEKSSIQASAKPGDKVVAFAHTIPLFNDIQCVRLGELEFTLEQCDLE